MQEEKDGEPRGLHRGSRTGDARALLKLLAAAVLIAACGRDSDRAADDAPYQPAVQFGAARGWVITSTDTIPLALEVAEREDQRSYGLMERPALPDTVGMIFIFDSEQPESAGFWMYRTRIPLDIAYLDDDGTIVSIRPMYPCPSPYPAGCPIYPAGAAYYHALEVNHGWFAARGVSVGDRVVVER